MSKIKNIIFDVGKVLVSYEPEAYLKSLGFDEDTQKAVLAALFEAPIWDESDRGTYPAEEILRLAIENDKTQAKAITRAWETVGQTVELLPYVEEWLEDLKNRGYKLYVLSNYSAHMYEQTQHKMSFLPYMEGCIFSNEYKLMKPEPEIYKLLLEKYALDPSECVFIDDRPVNIEGAKACGIQGIVFTDYESGRKQLDALLAE